MGKEAPLTTTEPTNGHRVTDAPAFPQQRPEPAATSEFEEVQQLAQEREKNHQIQRIQQDPVFRSVRTQAEMDSDRKVAEEIHTAERNWHRKLGLKRAEHQAKLAQADDEEALDLKRAQRKRRTFTDGAAALVSAYRAYRLVSGLLIGTTTVGIGWTSYNFATGLTGGEVPSNPLLFGIEPLFSVQLIVLMITQMYAALRGRLSQVAPTTMTHSGRRLSRVGWIQAGLLVTTTVIGVAPSLMELFGAAPFNPQMLAVRLCAPALVALSVGLQLIVTEVFADIIRDAQIDGDDEQESTVRDRSARAADRAVKVIAKMREGSMELREDGYPSVKEICRHFPSEKSVAQTTRDILPTFLEFEQRKGV